MISADTVTRTWQRVGAMPAHEAPRLVEQMRKEQPVILAYLMAMSEQPEFSPDDREIVFYLGMVVWQIMRQSPRRLRRVSERMLDQVLQANEDQLKKLASGTGADLYHASRTIVDGHAEPEVLRYVVEALMDEDARDPDDPPLSAESVGLAFLSLKNILDALVLSLA